jgi:transcriptional regulator with XRE-family HTH domain
VIAERDDFGPRLRLERERRGITLDHIAAATKISRPLLVALERSDVSRWPLGIFRRSFIRAYAEAVGLDPVATAAEFARLFPEPGAPPAEAVARPEPGPAAPLRLTLESERVPRTVAVPLRRAALAAADACLVLLASVVAAWAVDASLWSALGVVALVYYTGTLALVGSSPAAWWFGVDRREAASAPNAPDAEERVRAPRRETVPVPRRTHGRTWRARQTLTRMKS